jgi:hypothetical protein
MTVNEYYAAIRGMRLTPTRIPTVFMDSDGTPYHVRSPDDLTPGERAEFVAKLRFMRGEGPAPF